MGLHNCKMSCLLVLLAAVVGRAHEACTQWGGKSLTGTQVSEAACSTGQGLSLLHTKESKPYPSWPRSKIRNVEMERLQGISQYWTETEMYLFFSSRILQITSLEMCLYHTQARNCTHMRLCVHSCTRMTSWLCPLQDKQQHHLRNKKVT